MNCQNCLDRLQHEWDGGSRADVAGHLRECADCRALVAAAAQLQAGLRHLQPAVPPRELAGQIVLSVRAQWRRDLHRRWFFRGAVLAASVVLLVGTIRFQSRSDSNHQAATPDSQAQQPVPKEEPAVVLRETVNDAGSAMVALTTRTADATVGPTRLLIPVVTSPVLDDLGDLRPNLEGPATALQEAGLGLSAGFEPVTSARRAVGLLLRDLPPMDGEAKPGL